MHIAMAILAQQPAKGLYLLGALAFEATRFPIYLVRYLLRYGRQHPEWTLRQSLLTHVAAAVIRHLATIQHRTPLPLQAGAEGERFTTIKPAAATAYTGPLRGNADVAPVEIGATWYPAALHAGSTTADVCVLLHIHGGAYVMGDGRTRDSGFMAQTLLRHTNATHLLFPQYRLSTLPASATSNPFPAGLQDSLTAYLYLVNDLAIAPKHIILSGDSAGGNISHHISVRHGSGRLPLGPLRLAGCVMLWPYFGGEEPSPSEAASPPGDPMGTALFNQMWRLALPAGATKDHPAANPFAPGSVPFGDLGDTFPPVLVLDPDQDALHDRVADYVARLRAAGKAVEFVVFRGQEHAFFVREPCGEASDELIRVVRRFVHGG